MPVQFNNALQTPEDWADRVLSLATRAFRDLPETHMYQQAVVRQIKRPEVMPPISDLKSSKML
jgi:hypothetical protein